MFSGTPMSSQPEIRNIFERVKNARTDPVVGISIVKVTGDDLQGVYVSELGSQSRITAHYHLAGSEIYQIVNGEGKIHTGIPVSCDEIVWNTPVGVRSGDCFTLEEGKVHQLENTSPLPMVIAIVCPAAHIGHDRS
jgi:mannose-6-phosphate isomerase-like protein (cupin superfamily)